MSSRIRCMKCRDESYNKVHTNLVCVNCYRVLELQLKSTREMHDALIQEFNARGVLIQKKHEALRECITAIEQIHPKMNPEEPCTIYEAWINGKEALALTFTLETIG